MNYETKNKDSNFDIRKFYSAIFVIFLVLTFIHII